MLSKINSIRFATEAAITILRIDDMIKLAPEQREERPHHWVEICYFMFVSLLKIIYLYIYTL